MERNTEGVPYEGGAVLRIFKDIDLLILEHPFTFTIFLLNFARIFSIT